MGFNMKWEETVPAVSITDAVLKRDQISICLKAAGPTRLRNKNEKERPSDMRYKSNLN